MSGQDSKRTAMGIKLADCAALCGISINNLSRIENGLGIKLTSKELSAS